MRNFDKVKGEIVYRILNNEYISDECEFFQTNFHGDENTYIQAKSGIVPDNDLYVYFSIPKNTENIFITVSDGASELVRKIIGNAEQLDVNDHSYFQRENVIRYDNEELNEKGVFGITLLPLSVSGILKNCEETFSINKKTYSFRLITLLSKLEMEIWENDGFDALMEYFDENDKDLLTFEQ